jgi:hypothetical protein
MHPYGKHPCSEIGNRSNQPGTLLHGLDYRQVPPSQRLHLRRQGGVMFAIPSPSGKGFAKRYERKARCVIVRPRLLDDEGSEPAVRPAVA